MFRQEIIRMLKTYTYRDNVTRDEFITRNRSPLSIAVNLARRWEIGECGQ